MAFQGLVWKELAFCSPQPAAGACAFLMSVLKCRGRRREEGMMWWTMGTRLGWKVAPVQHGEGPWPPMDGGGRS